jgi:peptide/nickel transport system substrate-binding protein
MIARKGRSRWPASALAVMAAGALALSACGGPSAPVSATGAKQKGGTVTYAEAAGTPPNYIFPLEAPAYYTGANSEDFSYLFWLPVYWFGQGTAPTINWSLSLGYKPVYSDHGRVVSVTLKPYKWSDGQPVTAQDVLFWMQLMKANKDNWGAYVPGGFPDNVTSMQVTGEHTIVFHLNRAYSSLWFTYNELSQLVAIPKHVWDRTSLSGPVGNYAATPAGARAVYKFLDAQSKDLSTYATNPLWKVVDGPFRLAAFTTTGEATLVPNRSYSGGSQSIISKLVELPFTSTAAEFNALLTGNTLDVGYLPINDLRAAPRLKALGYAEQPQKSWSITYIDLNYHNPAAGPLFRQLYLREAMQYLIDQPAYIKDILHGAGWPTYGPVPSYPPSHYISSVEKSNPFPYDPAKAIALLRSHGWAVHPGGTDVCVRPGTAASDCGPGVARGARLAFKMLVNSGTVSGAAIAEAMRSSWDTAGIQVTISYESGNDVFAAVNSCLGASPSSSACSWQMGDSGAGGISWFYSDDYLPTGGELFKTGGTSNSGQYSNPAIDRLITQTHTSSSLSVFYRYENALTRQLPVLWMPSTATVVVWKRNLHGILPLSSVYSITPWTWYFTK